MPGTTSGARRTPTSARGPSTDTWRSAPRVGRSRATGATQPQTQTVAMPTAAASRPANASSTVPSRAPTGRGKGGTLGTASHAADQDVLGDAVVAEKLLRALELHPLGQRPIGLGGRLWKPCSPKDVDDMLLRDLHGFTLRFLPRPMTFTLSGRLLTDAVETEGRRSSLERMVVRDREGGDP